MGMIYWLLLGSGVVAGFKALIQLDGSVAIV